MEFIKSIYKVSDEVVFGKEFKVLKELPKGRIYMKIGGSLSEHEEYFYAYEENGMLEYKDDRDCFQFSLTVVSTITAVIFLAIYLIFPNALTKFFEMPAYNNLYISNILYFCSSIWLLEWKDKDMSLNTKH